jgi:hypothetical protein
MPKMRTTRGIFSATVKKSIVINAPLKVVWDKISNIIDVSWIVDVRDTVLLSKIKKGIGAARKLTFSDGSVVQEHVVDWKTNHSFSYIATKGFR